MYDFIIKNAIIADGSENELFYGSVAVSGDTILAVKPYEIANDRAETVIDAKGLMLSSGKDCRLFESAYPCGRD